MILTNKKKPIYRTSFVRYFSAYGAFLLLSMFSILSYANELNPATLLDQVKQHRANQLDQELSTGVLPQADIRRILGMVSRERRQSPFTADQFANDQAVGACACQAICQTITLWTADQYFEGSGIVSSPSACADAAGAYCGAAYSTWLSGWSCKPL